MFDTLRKSQYKVVSVGALASAVRPRIERSIEQVLNADVQTTRKHVSLAKSRLERLALHEQHVERLRWASHLYSSALRLSHRIHKGEYNEDTAMRYHLLRRISNYRSWRD